MTKQQAPSFSKALFRGEILEDLVFPFPKFDSDTAEVSRMMIDSIGKFKATVDPRQWDVDGHFPKDYFRQLAELGLMGVAIPEEYGGLGLSATGYVRVMEEIANMDGSTAVTLGGHQSIGYKGLTLFGTAEQKAKYYPKLASGELIACFALTEPGSGSDAGSIRTKAKLSPDGKHFIVNGEKIWITNGSLAGFMTLFAKTEEKDAYTGEVVEKVTAMIVDLPCEGVTFGPPEDKMGIRASHTTSVYFENAKVPVENLLGERGKGFKVAMEVLNNGRLGLAGGSVGGCKAAIKLALGHANSRKQFGKTLGEFGMIQSKIGRMVVDTYVAESMVYMTTELLDNGEIDYSLESAIAKVYATETVWRVSNDALQIMGGMGYMRETGIERITRDARINLIFEGANEILRLFIALAGLQGPGEQLQEVARALREPVKQIGVIGGFAAKRLKLNVIGTSVNSVTPALKREAGLFEDYVAEFALQCQKLLQRHGKNIAERQFACKRVADIAIDLFGMACVLSRVTRALADKGAESAAQDIAIAQSFFFEANRRIRGNFKSIDRNDDDQLKKIAAKHLETGVYSWELAE